MWWHGGLRGGGHNIVKGRELVASIVIRSASGETDVLDT
jgi:hypothetical protein